MALLCCCCSAAPTLVELLDENGISAARVLSISNENDFSREPSLDATSLLDESFPFDEGCESC